MSKLSERVFRILMIVAALAAIGLVYWTMRLAKRELELSPITVTAPTSSEYESQAKNILGPFFVATDSIKNPAQLKSAGVTLEPIIKTAEDQLLQLRVPASDKDAHLNLVLLLEKWQRLVAGSAKDLAATVTKTNQVKVDYVWLVK